MNVLNGLKEEELIQEMEAMMGEIKEKENRISLLETDKQDLEEQILQQKRQISQLTAYAEALNKENSEEGVKKLKENITKLKNEIETIQSSLRQQKELTEKKEGRITELMRTLSVVKAERDRAEMSDEYREKLLHMSEEKLAEKPLTVEKIVYRETEACRNCGRDELNRLHRELAEKEKKQEQKWAQNRVLLLSFTVCYLIYFISAVLGSAYLLPDLAEAGSRLIPVGWPGWVRILLFVMAVLLTVCIVMGFHHLHYWNWKDDLFWGMLVSVVILFGDRLRAWTNWNLAWLILGTFSICIVRKILLCIVRER